MSEPTLLAVSSAVQEPPCNLCLCTLHGRIFHPKFFLDGDRVPFLSASLACVYKTFVQLRPGCGASIFMHLSEIANLGENINSQTTVVWPVTSNIWQSYLFDYTNHCEYFYEVLRDTHCCRFIFVFYNMEEDILWSLGYFRSFTSTY